ncbi:hypothetical protein BV25DRAFT_1489454 [Artomyces pyxidatus]|uniref:Uncharacterized protein n=1 Tax=Artomyces pyxidatus TaxID=48021 RepID=A0ACB8TAS8_9AGAM|nr:hypothetical protein BV25DRAFT_1489454 [Artomyces pyxidatus]
MQPPTCTGVRVRTAKDAEILFHAVAQGLLPMVERRLDSEERMYLCSGCVYVWEERSTNVSESVEQGIERFTEGRSWGPSRARDDFLFYNEKDNAPKSLMVERTRAIRYQEDPKGSSMMFPRRRGERMIKQTYSVYINGPKGIKKWHLNAYWTQETLDLLTTVDDHPGLRNLVVPKGFYICARSNRTREHTARSVRSTSSESTGSALDLQPSVMPTYASYPSRRSSESYRTRDSSPPSLTHWDPPPTITPHAHHTLLPAPSHNRSGLLLAPLEQLENIKRSRRDPADERMLRSFTPCY